MQLNLIREARKKRRLSQGKLAAEIGIQPPKFLALKTAKDAPA
jgi:DNA-binding XRE family transcriptional regulator